MNYKGGKGSDGVYHRIINQIPPHQVYIEPFLGGGAIMLNKKPAALSIGIEIDLDVVRWWESVGYGGIVMHGDAISFLRSYEWRGGEYVYLDPPYLKVDVDGKAVRSWQRDIYRYEFGSIEQHKELLSLIVELPCMVGVSGYWSELYATSLKGWRTISYKAGTRGGTAVTEWMWMNYDVPSSLHDYRYLGDGFREREKITRVKKRWRARLLGMPALQRYAVLSVLTELDGGEISPK